MQKVKQPFYFRKDEEGNKRDTVEVEVPTLEVSDVLEYLNDEEAISVHSWILDGINSQIVTAARKQVDSRPDFVTGDLLNEDQLDISYLASIPKSTRGLGLTKEDWEDFIQDYVHVMTTTLAKEPEKAEKAAALLKGKFNAVKTNKAVIEVLVSLLSQWFTTTDNAAKYSAIYEYLSSRAEQLLAQDEQELADFLD